MRLKSRNQRKRRLYSSASIKRPSFESEDEGQMALHLDRMKRHGCEPDEAGRMGMLLCACKTAERVDPEETARSGIQLAT